MAFEQSNITPAGARWSDFQTRTNKTTNAANVQILKGVEREGCGDRIDIDLTYAVGSAGAQITFTQNNAISGLRYYKIYVTDNVGNEVTDLVDVAAVTTPIVTNTSGLDASQTWSVFVALSDSAGQPDCSCESKYRFDISDVPGNPTDTIDTADVVGALAATINGTSVADGGSVALTAASVGDVVTARLALTNSTAGSLVTISSITGSGDGSFSQIGYLPIIVNDSSTYNEFVVTMDTASAGAKTFSIVVTSDDAASPYNIDVTLTVS